MSENGRTDMPPREPAPDRVAELRETLGTWGERVGHAARSAADGLRERGVHLPRRSRVATPATPEGRRARAEELVNDFSSWLKRYGSAAGSQILRAGARAREEIEDIWAEAQSVRDRSGVANSGASGGDERDSPPPNDGVSSVEPRNDRRRRTAE